MQQYYRLMLQKFARKRKLFIPCHDSMRTCFCVLYPCTTAIFKLLILFNAAMHKSIKICAIHHNCNQKEIFNIFDVVFLQEYGYFIEFGANDGEKDSVSLFFEMKRKWKGLLIEQDSDTYKTLRSKNRLAHTMNACVSQNISPAVVCWFIENICEVQFELPQGEVFVVTEGKPGCPGNRTAPVSYGQL